MKKNELFLFAAPLLVIVALLLTKVGTRYAEKVHLSQETIFVHAGVFNQEAGSRALLKNLSSALQAHPDSGTFVLTWHVNTTFKNGSSEQQQLNLTYNRQAQIFEQGGSGHFRYKGVTDEAMHEIAAKDKTVVPLTPDNYTGTHIFTAKQRLAHGFEILPTDDSGIDTTVVVEKPQ